MSGVMTKAVVIGGLIAIPLGLVAGSGVIPRHLLVIAAVVAIGVYSIAVGISKPEDRRWLPTLMLTALLVKLAGATLRHQILFGVYEGEGDAVAYHQAGLQVADTWRDFVVPSIESAGSGGFGTHFVSWLTGLIYAPFEPSSLGGFWIFASFAFFGQMFMYAGFRTFTAPPAWRRYAILVFFWPTLIYWPSSLGKEALLIFLIGLATWATARLYRQFKIAWLIPIGAAVGVAGLIRIHVAALLVGAILAGMVFSRGPRGTAAGFRRIALVALGLAAMFPLVLGVAQQFGVSFEGGFSLEDLDPAFSDIETRTQTGGSAVTDTGAIRSPADVPGAILKVLFRPLPNEVANLQTALAAFEGVLLMGLLFWRGPQIFKNFRRVMVWPYLMMSAIYTVGFVFAWSAINNLGIMTRQRSLLLPILFAFIVGLGWSDSIEDPSPPDLRRRLMAPGNRANGASATPRRANRTVSVS
jgi:hypothetical protein